MARDREAVAFEADYWRTLCGNVEAVNALVVRVAGLVGMLGGASPSPTVDYTLELIVAMQDELKSMLRLIEGRATVLAGELAEAGS